MGTATELWITALASGAAGWAASSRLVRLRLQAPPRSVMARNYRGELVPVVLGGPLALGGLAALACLVPPALLGWAPARLGRLGPAIALLIVVMYSAGLLDDRRGDEPDRGLAGHLRAAAGGRLTGGVVKLVAGGAVGLGAGALVASGWRALGVGIAVALAANLVNLTDRAPGRAAKVFLLLAGVAAVAGDPRWLVGASGLVGACLACMGPDLGARAMLGDAGANPLGAVAGLGLALAVDGAGLVLLLAVLSGMNLVSERYSFSRGIDRVGWLRALDRLGRK